MKNLNYKIIILFILTLNITSCIVVKRDKPEVVEVSPPQYTDRSNISIGGDAIFTRKDDLALQLPSEWEIKKTPTSKPNIEAIASNTDETLYFVLAYEGASKYNWEDIGYDEILSVGNEILSKRLAKGNAIKTKSPERMKIQDIYFSTFRTSSTGGAIESRNSVLVTRSGNIYSISLIPVNNILNQMPTPEEIDNMFVNILRTVLI